MPKRKFEEERDMDPLAIHRAAKKGDLHRVRQLVGAGASMDSRDDRGRTPLLVAACFGHRAVVEFLINCKLYPGNRKPPLLLDMENDDGLFLQHDNSNYTLLHFSSRHGWADIAQIIIEKESDLVNAAASGGCTPLIAAAMNGRVDVAALLLRSGADVNLKGPLGMTALHWAVDHDHVRLFELLLREEGLDLNSQNVLGNTALHFACWGRDREEVIRQLLAAGADVHLKNKNSETPLTDCLDAPNPSLEGINLCVQHGAFFQDLDYWKIYENPVLRENVLKNVDLCTQSVINKFRYQTLPAVYSSSYFASILPSMDNFMLNTAQKEEVKNFVRRDIQINSFCNVIRVRPTVLAVLSVQCLAAYKHYF